MSLALVQQIASLAASTGVSGWERVVAVEDGRGLEG